MKLISEFVRLPYRFDVERLKKELALFKEADWRSHPAGFTGNLSLPLISVNGEMNDDFSGPMKQTKFLDQCPYITQIFSAFGEVFGRSRLMRLEGGCEVPEHSDLNYHWYKRVRIHVPIVTNEKVTFYCGDEKVHMAEGEAWIFDAWKKHRVQNMSDKTRVHLVMDTTGSANFWDMVNKSEHIPDRRAKEFERLETQVIPFEAGRKASAAVEKFNAPLVMMPGEVDELIDSIIQDINAYPSNDRRKADDFINFMNRFRWDWRQNWALYGPSPEGWPHFQSLIDRASASNKNIGHSLGLDNLSSASSVFLNRVLVSVLNTRVAEHYRKAFAGPNSRNKATDFSAATRGKPAPTQISRNGPCVCGSGKKYKRCCGK